MDIVIRNVNLDTDIQGIRAAHGDDEHWGSDEACFMSGRTRLDNGFFIQVALYGDKIVGHAEWVLSDEPCYRFLYLGMLQIHKDYQKRSIGSKLIDSGREYAKENGCAFLRTMPSVESGSFFFYQKNGFVQIKDKARTLKLKTMAVSANVAVGIDKVPFSIVKVIPLTIGLYQHASAHIWKVYNAQHKYDDRTVSSFKIGESYINIGAFKPTDRASVTCWSKQLTVALITEILAIGYSLGYSFLSFCILDKNLQCFNSFDYEDTGEQYVFMERFSL